MTCPRCGSENITAIEWHGPTGVASLDGVREYQTQRGMLCHVCGAIEEM
jgi:hypothetical protein